MSQTIEFRIINLDKIGIQCDPDDGSPINPRGAVQDTADLQETIGEIGLKSPILVRPDPAREGHFLIIHGHRRYTAVSRLGWVSVGCNIQSDGDWVSDTLTMLSAESQQEYPPLALARRIVKLKAAGLTNKQIATAWGRRNADVVSAHEHLLTAPEKIQQAVMDGRVGISVFSCIKKLSPEEQEDILQAHEGEITLKQVKDYRRQRKVAKGGFASNALALGVESIKDVEPLYQQVLANLNLIEVAMRGTAAEDWPATAVYLHQQTLEQLEQIRPFVAEPSATAVATQAPPKWKIL